MPPSSRDRRTEIDSAVAGEAELLERLLREAEPELRRGLRVDPVWSRSLDVDDVLQVTWLEAFLRIGGLEQRTWPGFCAWLRRIAENNLVDAVRALERDKRPDPRRRDTRGPQGESTRTLLMAIAGEQATAGSQAALAEEVARMRAAITRLPKSYRTVIEEMDLAEVPVREMAERLGRSTGAVHMLRSRAHDRLRELLLRGE